MFKMSRVLGEVLLFTALLLLPAPVIAQTPVVPQLKRELLQENEKTGRPLTRQQVDELSKFLAEPKAETRATPSITVGFYDSPGPATAKTTPLGNRTPLILIHGSGSDVMSDGSFGRPLDDKERWKYYLDSFNNDSEFPSLYKVYRFVYDSRLAIDTNASNLVSVINNIKTYPGWASEDFTGKDFVILAHSMGGLVARAAMNKWLDQVRGEHFGDRVINLVTIGTPHHGSPAAVPLWVYDSVLRKSGITETDFDAIYVSHRFVSGAFEPYEGEFDLAWDNYDDGVPKKDIYQDRTTFVLEALKVGGDIEDHKESINSPYTGELNQADPYTDRLILFAGENPPQAWVHNIADIAKLNKSGTLNEHHFLGYTSNKLSDVIAGDKGEGGRKPYNVNDGLVPLQSASFDGNNKVSEVKLFDNCDHLSFLDDGQIIDTVKTKLKEIAPALPSNMWTKTFGEPYDDSASSVQQTSDGGYILAGKTGWDLWLIKTDADGKKLWDKTFDTGLIDEAYSVQQTNDGGYIIAGMGGAYPYLGGDAWLIKTDGDGNRQWDKTFGGGDSDWASSVQQTADGGYIITGGTYSYGAGSEDAWLI